MTSPERFATNQPRATVTWTFACFADDAYFLPDDQIPQHLHGELEQHNGLPCIDGGYAGAPGPWCCDCHFGGDGETLGA